MAVLIFAGLFVAVLEAEEPGPTPRLHVALRSLHRPQSYDMVTYGNPFKAHVYTVKLHGAAGFGNAWRAT